MTAGVGLGFAALATPTAAADPCAEWQQLHPGWPCSAPLAPVAPNTGGIEPRQGTSHDGRIPLLLLAGAAAFAAPAPGYAAAVKHGNGRSLPIE
ncbi:hypothetical protein [Nocardia altamirensis]|uniref:hypothetical protein n=1 Tax=Nocardia altamirensis TaxID=472158 RepID=UPI00114CAE58|nr:hypothetical protein [Nocardia altamirensis]